MRDLPTIIHQLGEQAEESRAKFNMQSPELKEIREQLVVQQRQRYWLTTAATAIISGALVLTLGASPVIAWALLGVGAVAAFAARP
jgi:hypothetical protein